MLSTQTSQNAFAVIRNARSKLALRHGLVHEALKPYLPAAS